jgi:hypothetical protein
MNDNGLVSGPKLDYGDFPVRGKYLFPAARSSGHARRPSLGVARALVLGQEKST